jgi:hypothetical protein
MANTPDRALLSGLVDAYDRIAEESPGMGDPEFHEVEAQLFEAIVDAGLRAVIKGGSIYLLDSDGLPGRTSSSIPSRQRTWPTRPSCASTTTEPRWWGHGRSGVHLGSFDARDHLEEANQRMADITSEISHGP